MYADSINCIKPKNCGTIHFTRTQQNRYCPLFFPVIVLAPSVAIETILFKSILFPSRHFCTAFAISSALICPESGSNPRSSPFGSWEDIYLSKRATCTVAFMPQDSSIAIDKAEES
uniref:Uncharacterized protein n=1 Tax=Glossina palpalis gambiensis TaxID=67801 RepID=A0A1B0BZI3_9MUSC